MKENKLLSVVKLRVMEELKGAIQKHQLYRDKVEVYHKFPYKERPQMGVVLRNASASRVKLSPDDHAGTLKSYVGLARAENVEGDFLEWVWEDTQNMTSYEVEDLSDQVSGTNRVFHTSKSPIVINKYNTDIAPNYKCVKLTLNDEKIIPEFIDGKSGMIILSRAPKEDDTLKVNYYCSKLVHPGRYYIEIVSPNEYVIDRFLRVKGEIVIQDTSSDGTPHQSASLKNDGVYGGFEVLYTKKAANSNKIYLEKDVDYTIDSSGLITFLSELPEETTLYADYRFIKPTLGPFQIPKDFHYDNQSLPGVILAFGNQISIKNKLVVLVYPEREVSAELKSGHYNMSFDIEVVARDPIQLSDMTDHIISYIWGDRRLKLMEEGITIEELDPTGESEDSYDENTGDLYYKQSLSLQILTEWKKFVPYVTDLIDYDVKLGKFATFQSYVIGNQGRIFELKLESYDKSFEVDITKKGYPRYV